MSASIRGAGKDWVEPIRSKRHRVGLPTLCDKWTGLLSVIVLGLVLEGRNAWLDSS